MNLEIKIKAQKTLIFCKKKDKKSFINLIAALDELEAKNIKASNVKSLQGLPQGYRKKVGRYRILFTISFEKNLMQIWIIEIEKDTEKDYKKWLKFIKDKL